MKIAVQTRTLSTASGQREDPTNPGRARSANPGRARLLLLLAGWLLATGAHWDVVQVIAWTRMLADNSRLLSWPAAFERTFSPEGMCGLCEVVQAAKHHREGDGPAAVVNLTEKPPLILATAAAPLFVPWNGGRQMREAELAPPRVRDEPPVPPPRVS
jgi:hypothetical protein